MQSLLPMYIGLGIGLGFCILALVLVLRSFVPFFRRIQFLQQRVGGLGVTRLIHDRARIATTVKTIMAIRVQPPQ